VNFAKVSIFGKVEANSFISTSFFDLN